MKLSVCIQTDEVPMTLAVALLEGSFVEKVEKASSLGFEGVELMPTDPMSQDVDLARSTIESAGLEVAAIGTGAMSPALGMTLLNQDMAVAQQAQDRLIQLIDFAAQVGAPIVTIGSFRGRLAWGGKSAHARLTDALCQASDHAANRGVRVVIEPLTHFINDFINTADDGVTFVKNIGHPALGIMLDTYHVNIEENSWTEPFKYLHDLGLLWHIHVGDNNRLAPGKGLIDFPAIIETLSRVGYDGYLSAELLPLPTPDRAARDTIEHLKPLVFT